MDGAMPSTWTTPGTGAPPATAPGEEEREKLADFAGIMKKNLINSAKFANLRV